MLLCSVSVDSQSMDRADGRLVLDVLTPHVQLMTSRDVEHDPDRQGQKALLGNANELSSVSRTLAGSGCSICVTA